MAGTPDSVFVALGRDGSAALAATESYAGPGYPVDPVDLCDPLKGIEWTYAAGLAAGRRRRQGNSQQANLSDARVRDVARLLEKYNPYARGYLSALVNYTLGDQGFMVE